MFSVVFSMGRLRPRIILRREPDAVHLRRARVVTSPVRDALCGGITLFEHVACLRYRSDQPSKHHRDGPACASTRAVRSHHGNALCPLSCPASSLRSASCSPSSHRDGDWSRVSRSAPRRSMASRSAAPSGPRLPVPAAWCESRAHRPSLRSRASRASVVSCEPVPAAPWSALSASARRDAATARTLRRLLIARLASPPVRWIGSGTARRWRRSRLTTRPPGNAVQRQHTRTQGRSSMYTIETLKIDATRRVRIVADDDYQTRGSYGYGTDEETRAAEDRR